MLVEATVTEDDINRVHEGDPVTIEMETDESKQYTGTVLLISSIAEEGTEEVSYRIVAEFVPDDTVRFGMTAVLTIGEDEEPEEKAEESTAEKPAEEAAENDEETGETKKRERPEGAPEWPTDGSMPTPPEGGWPTDGSMPTPPEGGWQGSDGSSQAGTGSENAGE